MKCPKCRTDMTKKDEGTDSEHKYVFVCPKCGTKVG